MLLKPVANCLKLITLSLQIRAVQHFSKLQFDLIRIQRFLSFLYFDLGIHIVYKSDLTQLFTIKACQNKFYVICIFWKISNALNNQTKCSISFLKVLMKIEGLQRRINFGKTSKMAFPENLSGDGIFYLQYRANIKYFMSFLCSISLSKGSEGFVLKIQIIHYLDTLYTLNIEEYVYLQIFLLVVNVTMQVAEETVLSPEAVSFRIST